MDLYTTIAVLVGLAALLPLDRTLGRSMRTDVKEWNPSLEHKAALYVVIVVTVLLGAVLIGAMWPGSILLVVAWYITASLLRRKGNAHDK